MADRATNSFATKPTFLRLLDAWEKLKHGGDKIKVTGFAVPIGRLETGDQERAFLYYAGHFEKSGDNYINLRWLKDFAASNRQLHNLHALQLLQNWQKSKLVNPDWAEIVQNLAIDGLQLFAKSEQNFLPIISYGLHQLLRCKTTSSLAAIEKSIALFYAMTAFKGLDLNRKLASELFTSHIDKITLADGGPVSGESDQIIVLLKKLIPLRTATKSLPQSMHEAMARMLPFVAMLQDGKLLFASYIDPLVPIPNLAPLSGFGRLGNEPSIATVDAEGTVALFDEGIKLFTCAKTISQTPRAMEYQAMPQGDLLQSGPCRIFLSRDGKDLRCEDQCPELIFTINPAFKVSAMRDGGIMLVGAKQHWQLSLRGGEVLLEKNGTILKIVSSGGKLNWAMKKQDRASKHSSRKSQNLPDLLS
jgi:hypothetical protein